MARLLLGPRGVFPPPLFGGGGGSAPPVTDGVEQLFARVLSEQVVYGDNDLTTLIALYAYNAAGQLRPAAGLTDVTRRFVDPRTGTVLLGDRALVETETPGLYKAESAGDAHAFAAEHDGRTVDCLLSRGTSLKLVGRFLVRATRLL